MNRKCLKQKLSIALYFSTFTTNLLALKVLVTGTAGFIGFHLVNRLLKEGYEVVGIDNINDYYDVELKYARLAEVGITKENIGENIPTSSNKGFKYTFYKINIEEKQFIDKIFADEQPEVVCHLAAQAGVRYSLENPMVYVSTNISGFANILEASKVLKVNHFVYASSSSVYGLNESFPFSVSDNVDHPISLYAASKKSNELMAHSYSHLFGMPSTGLRFFSAYGPWGRPDMALYLFTEAIQKGEPIKVFNHGKMKRDFTYIDDLVEGVYRVIQSPPKGDKNWKANNPDPSSSKAPYKIYNIGNNNPVQLMEYIDAIEKALGKEAIKDFQPMQLGDVPNAWADVSALENDFGYRPSTKVEDGVRKFVEWYIQNFVNE